MRGATTVISLTSVGVVPWATATPPLASASNSPTGMALTAMLLSAMIVSPRYVLHPTLPLRMGWSWDSYSRKVRQQQTIERPCLKRCPDRVKGGPIAAPRQAMHRAAFTKPEQRDQASRNSRLSTGGVGSPSALAQQRVGAWIVGAAEVLAQGIGEQRLVRSGVPEQGHARAELEVVRRAEQRVRIVAGAQREPGAFAQAFAQQRVGEIGARFVQRRQAVVLRGRALAESTQLREHEPHPVAGLAAVAQFVDDVVIDGGLGIDEALQVPCVGHGASGDWLRIVQFGARGRGPCEANPGCVEPRRRQGGVWTGAFEHRGRHSRRRESSAWLV